MCGILDNICILYNPQEFRHNNYACSFHAITTTMYVYNYALFQININIFFVHDSYLCQLAIIVNQYFYKCIVMYSKYEEDRVARHYNNVYEKNFMHL